MNYICDMATLGIGVVDSQKIRSIVANFSVVLVTLLFILGR